MGRSLNSAPVFSIRVRMRVARTARGLALASVALALFACVGTNLLRPAQTAAVSSTDNTVNFQARLETATGAIVPDGYYNIEFKIYNVSSGGSALVTEDYTWGNGSGACTGAPLGTGDCRLKVVNGYFTVNLGSITGGLPTSLNWDQQMWVGMNVALNGTATTGTFPTMGDGEMTPRLLMTAVPYAFRAGQLALLTGTNTSTLGWDTQTAANSLLLPNEAGKLCTNASGGVCSGLYIQNQTASPQATAGFNIDGGGTFGGNLTFTNAGGATISNTGGTLTLDANNTLTLGSTNAVNINLGTNNAAHTIGIGNAGATGTQAITIGGSGNVNNTLTLDAGTAVSALQIGNSDATHGIQIGTVGTSSHVNTISIGSTNSTSSTTISGGANGTTSGGITLAPAGGTTNVGVLVKPVTNTTAAFQIQGAGSTAALLNVDTSGNNISLEGNNSPQLGTFAATTNMTTSRSEQASVISNGYIYSMGSTGSGVASTSVEFAKLNTNGTTGTWATTTTLPGTIASNEGIAANGYVYVLGGDNGSAPHDTGVVYYAHINGDGTLGTWQTSANNFSANPVANACAVTLNGYAYVIGGAISSFGTQITTVSFAKLNPDGSTGTWATTTVLNTKVEGAGCTAANGHIYVVGGYNGSTEQTIIQYATPSPTAGTIPSWTTNGTNFTAAGEGSQAVALNGYLYRIGGNNNTTPLSTIEYAAIGATGALTGFSSSTNGLGVTRYFGQAATSNGYLYYVGGYSGGTTSGGSSGPQLTVLVGSSPRISVGGSLDLVGVGDTGTLGDSGASGGQLTAGNTNIIGNLMVSNGATINQGLGIGGTLGVTGATALSGGLTVNTAASNDVLITSGTTVPTADQFNITNTGSTGVATAGVNALSINYKGGAGAIESSAERIDLQPGTTSGSTWSAVRLVANTTAGPATGVTENGLKVEGPTTGGAGTFNGVNIANIGAVVSGGVVNGINLTGTNSQAAGNVNAININTLTPGAATENAINVGGGWDNILQSANASIAQNGTVTLGSSGQAASIIFNGGGSNTVTLNAASGATYALTLPTVAPTVGQCLQAGATTPGLLVFNTCSAGGGSSLQAAYNLGNTILLTDGRDITLTAPDTTTDPNVVINLQCTTSCGANGRFAVQSGGVDAFKIAPNGGAATFRAVGGSANAFQIQNAGATANVLNVDNSNQIVTVQSSTDNATLSGTNLAATNFSTGWTGTNWTLTSTTAAHNALAGHTQALSPTSLATTSGKLYQVTYTITNPTTSGTSLSVNLGTTNLANYVFDANTFGTYSFTDSFVVAASSTGANLTFTPDGSGLFTGTISAVSVQLLTADTSPPLVVNNSSGTSNLEVRTSSDNSNLFMGVSAGDSNIVHSGGINNGIYNLGLGLDALQSNVSGSSNLAIGDFALQFNTAGAQNIAIGVNTLTNNSIGGQNIAIGTNALQENTVGSNNTAVGNVALQNNTWGNQNTAFGANSLDLNTTGSNNTAVDGLGQNTTGNNNTAVGGGLRENNGNANVAVGRFSNYNSLTVNNETAIGFQALQSDVSGTYNSSLGYATDLISSFYNYSTTNLQNVTIIGAEAQGGSQNSIILGFGTATGTNDTVGIGTSFAPNEFTVTPQTYATGTIAQTASTAIVGTGTTFTAGMVGGTIYYLDGNSDTIATFTDGTHITTTGSHTESGAFRLVWGGFNVKNNSTVLLQPTTNSTTAFQIKDNLGVTVFSADTSTRTITVAGDTTTYGTLDLSNAHYESTQTNKPTIGTPATCGTAPSSSVLGTNGSNPSTDSAGQFTVTAGTSGTQGLCTTVITFNKAYATIPKAVLLTGVTGNSGAKPGTITALGTSSFTFALSSASTAGVVYTYYYWVIE
jgi:hypothetical protein